MIKSNIFKLDAKKRRKVAAPLGIAFALLALIGVITVFYSASTFVKGIFDNTSQKELYQNFISPVVMMDPVPYSRVENIEQDMLLQSSLWAALMSDRRSAYSHDEFGLLLVPASDVDVAATKLFGPNVTLTHHSFDDYDASYLYDPEMHIYRVPSINKVAYSPLITEITKKNDTLILKVGYISPANIWSTDAKQNGNEPTPEKYMTYTLTKWSEGYYISSVGDIDGYIIPMS